VLLDPLDPFGVLIHGAQIFLKDDLLGRCWAHDLREVALMGIVPGGTTGVVQAEPREQGLQTVLGGLQIDEGILPRAGQIADGLCQRYYYFHPQLDVNIHPPLPRV